MAITKDTIFSAAADLVAAGSAATLAAVRKAVGGGSYTTISEALKEWRLLHQPQAPQAGTPALPDRLANVFHDTWAIAVETASAQFNAERAELEQSRREAADLADQLRIELEQAQAAITQQGAAAAIMALDIERQALETIRMTSALAEASESARTAQAALGEARTRAEQLTGLLEREQAARAEAVEQAAKAGQDAAVALARLEDARNAISEAKKVNPSEM